MTGLTASLARFIQERRLDDVPPGAIDKAKKVIADTFAVILAGAGSELAAPLARYLETSGECGTSPILGTSLDATPEAAAMINGAFGHALDFDDVLSMMPAHPSAIVIAALLAATGTRPLSGRALIEAYVLGVEAGGKIGLGITVGHYHRGFHGTGTLGIFSALAALAKSERLTLEQTRMAFGIAASMASGLRRNFGTMTKPLHTGWAARSALVAVRLAGAGFTAAEDVMEADAGFFAAYGVDASDANATARALGQPWVIVDPGIALKRFPCCYACHRAMDGILVLRERLGFDADSVERVVCRMPPGGLQVLPYPRPRTGLEGKFSLEYCLAAGVLDGAYRLSTFTDAAVARARIATLLGRIDAHEEAHCGGEDPLLHTRSSGSRGFVEVEVVLKDGRRGEVRVDKPPGHPARELTWDEIDAKFRDCAGACGLGDRAEAALSFLHALERQPDLAALVDLLRP